MSHSATNSPDARIIEQCTQGRKIRNVASFGFSVGAARTNNTAPNRIMADLIQGETERIPVFVAPCNCKVLRIYANGTPFIKNNGAETSTLKLVKAVIADTDVDLNTTITIGLGTAPTTDTAIDAVLSTVSGALDLLEGQHVYATVVVGATVETAVAYVTGNMEWVPTDTPNS